MKTLTAPTKVQLSELMTTKVKLSVKNIRPEIYVGIPSLKVEEVIDYFCELIPIPKNVLIQKTNKEESVRPRQILHWFLAKNSSRIPGYTYFTLSLEMIGKLVGDKNHATVLNSVKVINNEMETNKRFKEYVVSIEEELKQKFNIK